MMTAAGGEGCSTAGGCATCPFMKMNDLDALIDVARWADQTGKIPSEFFAGSITTKKLNKSSKPNP